MVSLRLHSLPFNTRGSTSSKTGQLSQKEAWEVTSNSPWILSLDKRALNLFELCLPCLWKWVVWTKLYLESFPNLCFLSHSSKSMRMQLGLWEYCLVGGEIKKKCIKIAANLRLSCYVSFVLLQLKCLMNDLGKKKVYSSLKFLRFTTQAYVAPGVWWN